MANKWNQDYYKILGVDRNATQEEIKKAYRRYMFENHPDKTSDDGEKAKLGNEAYDVLNEKKGKKAAYDAWWDKKKEDEDLAAARKKAAEQEAARKQAEREAQRKAAEQAARRQAEKDAAAKRAYEEEAERKAAEQAEKDRRAYEEAEAEAIRQEKARQRAEEEARKQENKRKREAFFAKFKRNKNDDDFDEFEDDPFEQSGPPAGSNDDFRTYQLNRTPKKGKLKKPIAYIAATAILVSAVAGAYFLGKSSNKDETREPDKMEDQDPTSKPNEEPTPSTPDVQEPAVQEPDVQEKPNTQDTSEAKPGSSSEDVKPETDEKPVSYGDLSGITSLYDEETLKQVVNVLRQTDSTLSADQADDIILAILNDHTVPAINNTIDNGNRTVTKINLSAFIADGTTGKEAIKAMESYLNGLLTDPENSTGYATKAYEMEARILGEDETVQGLGLTETCTVDPSVKYIWSRLAIGTNIIADALGENIIIEINGQTYTSEEINNSNYLENIAQNSIKDLGSDSKNMNLN